MSQLTSENYGTSWRPTPRQAFIAFVAIAIFAYTLAQYGLVLADIRDLGYDAKEVWKPMAQAMADGARPYADLPDNKPPLFVLLIALGSLTDFAATLWTLIAIANATLVIGVYRWCSDAELPDAGVIASLLVAGTIVTTQSGINNKVFGLVMLFGTLRLSRPLWVGVGLACMSLFAQPLVVAIPAVAIWKCGTDPKRLGVLALAGVATVALVYLSLAVVWDVATVRAGIEQSLVAAIAYSQGTSEMFGQNLSIFSRPMAWFLEFRHTFRDIIIPALGGLAGGYLAIRHRNPREILFVVALALSLGVLLLVRPYSHYGLTAATPLSILSGYAVLSLRR